MLVNCSARPALRLGPQHIAFPTGAAAHPRRCREKPPDMNTCQADGRRHALAINGQFVERRVDPRLHVHLDAVQHGQKRFGRDLILADCLDHGRKDRAAARINLAEGPVCGNRLPCKGPFEGLAPLPQQLTGRMSRAADRRPGRRCAA